MAEMHCEIVGHKIFIHDSKGVLAGTIGYRLDQVKGPAGVAASRSESMPPEYQGSGAVTFDPGPSQFYAVVRLPGREYTAFVQGIAPFNGLK